MESVGPVVSVPVPGVVVLAGAAGAGKSTFAARHFPPDAVLSSDSYRAALSGDPGDQRVTRLAFSILHREVVRRIAAGRLAVVDATSVRPFARRTLIRLAARAGVPAVAIVLDLPSELVRRRNAGRARPVPEAAVTAQLAELARGLALIDGEGFATVVVLRTPEEVDRIRVVLAPAPEAGRPAGG